MVRRIRRRGGKGGKGVNSSTEEEGDDMLKRKFNKKGANILREIENENQLS